MLKNISDNSNLSIIDIKQLKIINYSAFTTCNIMKGSGTHLHSSIGNGGKGRHTLEDAPDETKWFDEPKTLADAITWYQVPGTWYSRVPLVPGQQKLQNSEHTDDVCFSENICIYTLTVFGTGTRVPGTGRPGPFG